MRLALLVLLVCVFSFGAEKPTPKLTSKLVYMYQMFFLPFSVEFRQGINAKEAIPYVTTKKGKRMMRNDELEQLSKEWSELRQPLKAKSLFLTSPVGKNSSSRIAPRLITHSIELNRGPFDKLSIEEKKHATELLKDKKPEVVAAFRQLRFLKSFMESQDNPKFNLFIISPSWDESSREYQMLFETYMKEFPNPGFVLHSVVVQDPQEKFFESQVNKDLFPRADYAVENTPRFLAIENVEGEAVVREEGDALKEAYVRFFKDKRGWLDSKSLAMTGLK